MQIFFYHDEAKLLAAIIMLVQRLILLNVISEGILTVLAVPVNYLKSN